MSASKDLSKIFFLNLGEVELLTERLQNSLPLQQNTQKIQTEAVVPDVF